MSNYWKAQKRAGVKEIFPSMTTIQKPGGGKFIKPFTKIKGQKTVQQVKNAASAARASGASFNYKAGIGKAMRKMKDIK